ncbi:MAG: hypothetical protein IPJ74_15685 [Saprospiraceae bacterium]|nr:hypothetical protein [Saprospiraceae bacterium]
MVIQVQLHTRYQYFEKEVLDHIYQFLREELYANRISLPMYGLNYRCFSNISTKEYGQRNVFIEYAFEFSDKKSKLPTSIDIYTFDLKIFDDASEGINDLILDVKRKQEKLAYSN